MSPKITELVKDETRAKSQISLTPEFVFQAPILYWSSLWESLWESELYTYMHAHGGEFYNLGVGQAGLTMTQTPEAIKEKNW